MNFEEHIKYWKKVFDKDHRSFFWQQKLGNCESRRLMVSRNFSLPETQWKLLKRYANGGKLELAVLLLAGMIMVIKKYNAKNPIVFDTPLILGDTSNLFQITVPMVFNIEQNMSLKQIIEHVNYTIIQSYRYQDYPQSLNPEIGRANTYTSNILFQWNELHDKIPESSHYEFNIVLVRNKYIELRFDRNVFSIDFVEHWFDHLSRIFSYFNNLDNILSQIEIFSQQERSSLIQQGGSNFKLDDEKTILEYFEETARIFPSRIALSESHIELSYEKLDQLSNLLAFQLTNKVKNTKSTPIAVLSNSKHLAVVSMLAIFKIGAIYIPIDPKLPKKRIAKLLYNNSIHVLLHHTTNQDMQLGDLLHLSIEDLINERVGHSIRIKHKPNINDPAYIIFTSGSTGVPKGVVVTFSGLSAITKENIVEFNFSSEDKFLLFFSIAFDGAIVDIFMTLISGGKLILPAHEVLLDPNIFADSLRKDKITMFSATPSFLGAMKNVELSFVRLILSAGESLRKSVAKTYCKRVKLYNAYGPTEASVGTTLYEVKASNLEDHISIGKPRYGRKIYILDEFLNPLPMEVSGEIYIAGNGLAMGYLNEPEMTANKFVDDPFDLGKKMYRTGDLGKWGYDGNINFTGRIDSQIKINGFRIDPLEIERILQYHEKVKEAVVIKEQYEISSYLKAFILTENGERIEDLAVWLKLQLPAYMIPSYFIFRAGFPRSSNGKTDRRSLMQHSEKSKRAIITEREDEIQSVLVRVWKHILKHESIDIKDNFFELGGTSIKVIQMVELLQEHFPGLFKASDIYNQGTIEQISKVLKERLSEYSSLTLDEPKKDNNFIKFERFEL